MNEREALRQKIDALEIVRQELRNIYLTTTDLELADDLRRRINALSEEIDTLRMLRDRANASSIIPAPDEERIRGALQQLDNFVRADQTIHSAINFLMQVAAALT